MSDTFHVGDLVILQHASFHHEYDGWPAVIVGPFARRKAIDMRTMEPDMLWTWQVRIIKPPDCTDADDGIVLARPWQIRKPRADEARRVSNAGKELELPSC